MKKFSSKRALLLSVLSMVICVSMLIGSTFAWFTDSATANVNTIQAGNLDVELQIKNAEGNWVSAENATLDFVKATGAPAGEKTLWEPGCTYQLPELRIVNKGNLALKYQLVITGATGDTMLLDVIKFKATVTPENGATVTSDNAYGTTLISDGELLAGKYATLNISAHMDETAGNEYRGKSVSGIAIKVVATQLAHEFDSNGNDYDADASYPAEVTAPVTTETVDGVTSTKSDTVLKTPATVKATETETKPIATAVIPAGAKVDEGTEKLTLSITNAAHPAGFTVADDEKANTYEVKIIGVAADNTVEIPVELYVGKGLCNVKLYHNGTLMTDYTYDSVTGFISFKTATFSPFTVVSTAPAATVGGVAYESVDAAIAAATDGATIALAKDHTGNLEINGKNITLDFNGNKVNGILYIGCTNDGFTSKREASVITLKDSKGNGGVTSTASFAIIAKNGSKLTVESGSYVTEYAREGSSGYSDVIKMTDCELTVNGGYIHNNSQVGNYNRVIDVDNGKGYAKVTINGGKLEGTQKCGTNGWDGSYSYIIASNGSDDKFDVEINGGEFISHTGYSYITQVYGNVVVNDCTFTDYGTGSAFDIKEGYTVTVKGGTYTFSEKCDYYGNVISGLITCRQSDGWTSVYGTLVVDPASPVKVNYQTHDNFLAKGATQSAKGADGYYTITK